MNFLKTQKWISEVIAYDGKIPEYDNYCYMISLAYLIEWRPDTLPQKFPYIKTQNISSDKTQSEKYNIGIVSSAPKELSNYKGSLQELMTLITEGIILLSLGILNLFSNWI